MFGFAAGAVIKTFNPSKQARGGSYALPRTFVCVLMQLLQVISLIALFGDLFLNLLKMMVLPLIVCSMITGVTSIRSTGLPADARPQHPHLTLLPLLLLPPPLHFHANFRSEPRPSLFLDVHLLHRHYELGNFVGHDHVPPFALPSPTTSDALYFCLCTARDLMGLALMCHFRVLTIRPGVGKDLGSGSCGGGGNKEVEAISKPGNVVDPLDRRVPLLSVTRHGAARDTRCSACSTL